MKAETGKLEYDNREFDIKDVKIIIGDFINFEASYDGQFIEGKYLLSFVSDDGWKIEKLSVIINETNTHYGHGIQSSLKGIFLKFKAFKGNINNEDEILAFKILEDCVIGDCTKFKSYKLKGLYLLDEKISYFPRSTGYFVFQDSYDSIEKKWDEIFNNFHFLLGFFTSNFVNLRAYLIQGPNNYEEIRIFDINESTGHGGRIFYNNRRFETSKFLNSAYNNFVKYKKRLNLPIVIDYFIWMKNSPYIDSHRYLLGVILMEALKYAYAHGKYPKIKKYFKKPANTRSGYKMLYFKDLIQEIYLEFNLDIIKINSRYLEKEFDKLLIDKPYLFSIFPVDVDKISREENFIDNLTTYRNEVVHEGNLKADISETKRQMNYVEWSIEILLLKILNIDCLYWDQCESRWIETQELFEKLSIKKHMTKF